MTEFKLIAALLVLLAGVGGGYFAIRMSASKWAASFTALANTFAGGVFLGAAFLHMLPDAIEKFETFDADADYPLYALIAAAGFLVVLLLDKVVVSDDIVSDDDVNQAKGAIYPYILMMTLSIHSIITGIALGLEDHTIGAIAILIAVLAHKSTAAMALAISFGSVNVPLPRTRKLLGIFYTTTPLGILFGTWWAAQLSGPGEAMFEGIFDALAAGTFFYIAVMDILAEEFRAKDKQGHKHGPAFVSALFGFAVMAIVAIWT